MFKRLSLSALLLGAVLAAAVPVQAAEDTLADAPVGSIAMAPVKFHFPLSKFVPSAGPLTLRDSSKETKISIPVSARIKPTSLQVSLVLTNSISLVAARSTLAVRFNEATLAQVRLDPNNPNAAVKINIPVDLVRPGYNTMALGVVQHTSDPCEDPEAPELWTEINTVESAIDMTADYRGGAFTMADFDGFFAPGIGGARRLAIVTATNDPQLMDAGAVVAQAAALRAQYEPVKVRKMDLASDAWALEDHALVGTRDQLAAVIGKDAADKIDGPYLAFVAMDKRQARLIVSGKTIQEVSTAARTLAAMDIPLIDSGDTTIRDMTNANVAAPHGRALEPDHVYTFDDLGVPTTTARDAGVTDLGVTLPMAPDLYAPEQAKVNVLLDLNYGAGFGNGSVLNVEVNGKFVHGINLASESGGAFRGYSIPVPLRDFVGGANRINLSVHMRAPQKDRCSGISGRYLEMTVFGSSSVRLPPAGRMALQPDLDLFARTGFPYLGTGKPTVVWVPHMDLVSAAWTVEGRMAQAAGRPLLDTTFRVGGAAPQEPSVQIAETKALSPKLFAAAMHDVTGEKRVPYGLFRKAGGNAAPGVLADMFGLGDSATNSTAAPVTGYVTQSGQLGRNAVMTAIHTSEGATTVITADTADLVATAVDRLVLPEYWSRAQGDFMMWRDTPESVATFRFSPRFTIGEGHDMALTLRLYVSQHPWWWLGGSALVLVLLSGLSVWLLSRRRV